MKKLMVLVLTLICVLSMVACNTQEESLDDTKAVFQAQIVELHDVSETAAQEIAIPSARIPMVMVDGQVYYSTGKESTIEARCGMMDGEITSTVDVSEVPTENNQSNFGTGYGYQFVSEDTIEIQMEDGKWYVYEKGSGEGKIRFGNSDKWYDKGYLSEETLEWLYRYNSLSEEEQMAVNSVPKELIDAEEGFFEEAIDTEEASASIRIENPAWDYYIAENIQSGTKPYTIKLIEETANEIIDTEEWLAEHEFYYNAEKEMDGKYHVVIENNGTLVNIFEYDTCIAGLDFSDYMYAPDLVEADKDFVDETVHDVKVVDGILYASVFHYTYAVSAPSNAYIVAISLEDYSVIWKSQPLICNSLNFEIVDDVIFCGYGFTAEDDYLYQLDRLTGCVLDTYKLKSKADHIIHADGRLYVRTYDTDYVMEIVE